MPLYNEFSATWFLISHIFFFTICTIDLLYNFVELCIFKLSFKLMYNLNP